MARLILTLNNKIISNHSIGPGEQVSIGRYPDNAVIIDHPSVSGHHAAVRLVGQQLILTDIGSQNGTFVNDEQVSESTLAHQDWVTIGKHICIVDLYESLSMEATEKELSVRSASPGDADQTMVLEREEFQSGWINISYLFFLNSPKEDFDLIENLVTIGKNKDAKIKINGFWSFFAGGPSATIKKKHDTYILEHVSGMLKTKVNETVIKEPTKLKHQDIIKIGPIEVQFRSFRRPSR